MAGVTAWLAAVDPGLVQHVVSANALALTRAAVEFDWPVRIEIIEGLLRAARTGDIDPDWGLDLTGLSHPDLHRQLVRHFDAGISQPEQLRWLARIAQAGQCRNLVVSLLEQVVDPRWTAWSRRAAIQAIRDLGHDEELAQLEQVLQVTRDADPDDEVLAGVVDALYPRLMTTEDLLDVLRPRQNTHFIGSYLLLLGDLANRVPSEDLEAILRGLARQLSAEASDHDYGRLIQQLLIRGWNATDSQNLYAALAALIAQLVGPPRGHELEQTVEAWTVGDLCRASAAVLHAAEQIVAGAATKVQRDGTMLAATLGFWLALDCPSRRHSQSGR
jgi:hypothetical protein